MNLQDLLGVSLSEATETTFGVAGMVIVAMSLIQVSPLKVNPWSYIGKIIMLPFKPLFDMANKVNQMADDMKAMSDSILKLNSELETLKTDVANTREKDELDKIIQKRWRIIQFGDELRGGMSHSLERFNSTLEAIDDYENYCATHPLFENGKAVTTISIIKADYAERLRTNNFL